MGAYQVTLDGKFLFANQKMVEMFGYSSYEELKLSAILPNFMPGPQKGLTLLIKSTVKDS